jgi:hypothetical protein
MSKNKKDNTIYAACWLDQYDSTYGVYCVFKSRRVCLDYLVDTVFERAETLGVKVIDNEFFPEQKEISRKEVRDWLATNGEFKLVLSYDCCGFPEEYVSVGICETTNRQIRKTYE